jgi:hypothetical protein
MNGIVLPLSVGHLAAIADKTDGSRFALGCLQVRDDIESYSVVATDGKALVVFRGNYTNEEGPSEVREFLIPADDLATALSAVTKQSKKRRSVKPVLPVLAAEDEQWKLFYPGLEQQGQLATGRFPPWKDVLPKGEPIATAAFTPALVARLLSLAAKLGIESLVLCLYGGKPDNPAPVGLAGRTEDGLFVDMLVMPLSGKHTLRHQDDAPEAGPVDRSIKPDVEG